MAPAPEQSRRGFVGGLVGGLIGAIVILAILAATGWGARWLVRPDTAMQDRLAKVESAAGDQAMTAAQLESVEGKLAGLDQKLEALAQQPAPAAAPVDLAPLQKELADQRQAVQQSLDRLGQQVAKVAADKVDLGPVEQRLAALDQEAQTLGKTADERAARLDALGRQVAALEAGAKAAAASAAAAQADLAKVKDASTKAQTLAAGLVDLAAAVDRGETLAAPLDRLNGLDSDDQEVKAALATLATHRDQPVPSRADLRASLVGLAPAIASGCAPPEASDSWVEQARRNLQGLVSVQETGSAEGAARAGVEQATDALDKGDLPGAISAMQPLADGGNEAAAKWVASARDRSEALAAVGKLRAHLDALLTLAG
jgi:hypothetical protein